jgi:hypothetical protein
MAIERAEAKRRELDRARRPVGSGAQILSILPKAAEHHGQQISLGLAGDPAAAAKARPIVRELLGGKSGGKTVCAVTRGQVPRQTSCGKPLVRCYARDA